MRSRVVIPSERSESRDLRLAVIPSERSESRDLRLAVIPSERSESRDLHSNIFAPDFIRGGAERRALAYHDRRGPWRRGARRRDPSSEPSKILQL